MSLMTAMMTFLSSYSLLKISAPKGTKGKNNMYINFKLTILPFSICVHIYKTNLNPVHPFSILNAPLFP